MLSRFKKKDPSALDVAIHDCYAKMSQLEESDETYAKIADQLVKLHKLKMEEKSKLRVSPDTAATIGANLVGILLIIRHEHVNAITTKAMSQVMRIK